jgi:hypothetical protein
MVVRVRDSLNKVGVGGGIPGEGALDSAPGGEGDALVAVPLKWPGGEGSKEGLRKGLVIFRPRENPSKVEEVSNQEERYR